MQLVSPETTGTALVEVARSGSAPDRDQALTLLFERHRGGIVKLLSFLSGDSELAQDLTQEVFVIALTHLDDLRDCARLRSWLMQIARNVWRSHSRQVRQYSPLSFTEFTQDNSSRAAQLTYVSPEIEHFAEIDHVQQAFTQLSSLFKEALYFRHVIGLSDAEPARSLGISPGAAQKRVYRAETQFRREYDRLTREST